MVQHNDHEPEETKHLDIGALRDKFEEMKRERVLRDPTATPVAKAEMRAIISTKPKPAPKKRPQTDAAPPTTRAANDEEAIRESRSKRRFRDGRFRDVEEELKEFENEIANMTGCGSDMFSEEERLKNGRSLDDQRWEEAQRLREVREAKERWETHKEVDLRGRFGFQEEEVEEILELNPRCWSYYWCQYLSWTTCLCPTAERPPLALRCRR